MPVSVTVQLVSFVCNDHRKLSAFYREAFALEEVAAVASPIFVALAAGGVALGFHAEDALGLLGIDDRAGLRSSTHVTFDLGSADVVDASVDRLTALGASVVKGPFTTYYDARQVVFTDPEGNVFRVTDTQTALTVDALRNAG
ncbi:MAG: VOC family protein [Acidimicrobiia bacterium]